MTQVLSDTFLNKIVFSLAALLVTFLISFIAKGLLDLVFTRVKSRLSATNMARTQTIRSLLCNITDIILFLITILIILSTWGVNITPILTGAGIIGLAISFGSQTLVKDLIAGFFIIIEDQFHIGDKVQIDKYEGEVYDITLRLTVLRDKKGDFVYIPNSQITTVVRSPRT